LQPGREGVEVTVFVPERFGGRDTPWCGTRQRLRRRSSKGRRAESKAGISSSRTRQRLGRGPADGNRSRAVKARCGQNQAAGLREHLRIQPTPTSPFQNQPLRPFKSTTTFLLFHSKAPHIPLHPLSSHPTQLSLASNSTLRIVPSFIDQGVRGGAMAKLTS